MMIGGGRMSIVFLAAVRAIVVFVIVAYNRLMSLTQRSPASWSDMVARLPRRSALVFNVVESVKDYAAHERDTPGAVVQVAGLGPPRGARRPAATSSWTAPKERHVLTVSLGS